MDVYSKDFTSVIYRSHLATFLFGNHQISLDYFFSKKYAIIISFLDNTNPKKPSYIPLQLLYHFVSFFCFYNKTPWKSWLYLLPPGSSSGKERACLCRRCRWLRFNSWVRKISWRRKWQSTSVFLPGKSYRQRSLVWATVHGVSKHDWVHMHYLHVLFAFFLFLVEPPLLRLTSSLTHPYHFQWSQQWLCWLNPYLVGFLSNTWYNRSSFLDHVFLGFWFTTFSCFPSSPPSSFSASFAGQVSFALCQGSVLNCLHFSKHINLLGHFI